MTNFLLKRFVKDEDSRDNVGKLAGWVGLFSNVFLFGIKLLVGIITSSISIMTDAINNLTDGSSSLITIIGFHLSGIPADEEHPYGHARFEYISGLLVAGLVFLIGGQFLITSFKKTLNPEPTNLTILAVVLLAISIGIKIWQALFNRKLGKQINSKVLLATAIDSRNDVIITSVVLASSVVEYVTGYYLDGPMGMIVALLVIYSGIELIRDTLTPLIGQAPNKKLVKSIKSRLLSYPHVMDIHDLIVHNYGPEQLFVTVHIEMSASIPIMESHEIIDGIERDFLRQDDITLVVHLDPIDTQDPEWDNIEKMVTEVAQSIDENFSIHGFRIVRGKGYDRLLFDVTVPPEYSSSDKKVREEFTKGINERNPSYELIITVDREYTSTVN